MLIRIRSTGAVMYESEFRANNPNTSFPQQISVEVLNEFGADPVLNAPQPTPSELQVVALDGTVQDDKGNWMQNWVLVDKFKTYTNEEGVVVTKEEQDAAYLAELDNKAKAANKATAESKLAATDWTQVADVPLLNKQEFTDYRAAVRAIALNPPVQATFPDLPVEQWS